MRAFVTRGPHVHPTANRRAVHAWPRSRALRWLLGAAAAALSLVALPACDEGGDRSIGVLFYSDRDGDDDVYTTALDGSDLRRLSDDPGRDYEADASPDGSTLVFASERSGEPGSRLYLMDPDGSDVRRLTFSSTEGVRVIDDYAHWDRDGRRVVFQRSTIAQETGPDADIWLIDPETGEETQLTDTPDAWDSTPAFSPDGRSVLFESDRDGDFDVYRLDLASMAVTQLLDHEARELQVKESPSDGSLLFISNRDDDFEIFLADADGANPRQLTTNEADDRYPHWSPDGTQVLFSSDRSGNSEIYVMNADGSDVRQLTDDPGKDTDPHWAHLAKLD